MIISRIPKARKPTPNSYNKRGSIAFKHTDIGIIRRTFARRCLLFKGSNKVKYVFLSLYKRCLPWIPRLLIRNYKELFLLMALLTFADLGMVGLSE
jgi:hypothetical protein